MRLYPQPRGRSATHPRQPLDNRLSATELSVHCADVAFVIGESPVLTRSKAHDALELSCQLMPNIWTKLRRIGTPPPVRLCAIDVDIDTIVGSGEPVATATGTASDLRLRLWGRPAAGPIEVDGDATAFDMWTTSSPKGPID